MDYVTPKVEDDEDEAEGLDTDGLRAETARLRDDMLRAASELRFEEAARLRDRLKKLEKLALAR